MGLVRTKYLPRLVHTAELNKYVLTEYKREAIKANRPYIDMNNPLHDGGLLNVMMFDIDGGNAPLAWYDTLPFKPAYFAGKWKNNMLQRPHAVIYLRIPVKKTSRKQIRLFQVVYDEIANRLRNEGCKVDKGQKPTTKNPDSGAWDVIRGDTREWTLKELVEALELDPDDRVVVPFRNRPVFKSESETALLGRNCEIFETVRYLSYNYKKDCVSYNDMYRYVYNECQNHNMSFPEQLATSEIRAITKSISRFAWNRYDPKYKVRNTHAAADLVDKDQERKTREAIGALYSSSLKTNKTLKKIWDAKKELAGQGLEITKKAVARLANLHIQTVRKHWDSGFESVSEAVIDRLRQTKKVETYQQLCRIVDEEKLKLGIITQEEFDERYQNIFLDETHEEEEEEGIQEVTITLETDDMPSTDNERDHVHDLQRLLLSKKITKDEYKEQISEHITQKVKSRIERLNSILIQNKAPEGATKGAYLTIEVKKSGEILDRKRLDYVVIMPREVEEQIKEMGGMTFSITEEYEQDECPF